jgi:hypothetical protein
MDDLKAKLEKLRKQKIILETMIKRTMDSCKHEDIEESGYGSAICKTCGKRFSWYCPTSPTLECDYEHEDGHYNEDDCRYCGEPEERK